MYKLKDIATLKKLLETINKIVVQYSEMPEATAVNAGKIVQYVGMDNDTYKTGYFYQCTDNYDGTYSWEVIVSGGGGSATEEVISMQNVTFIEEEPDSGMFSAMLGNEGEDGGVMLVKDMIIDPESEEGFLPSVGDSCIMVSSEDKVLSQFEMHIGENSYFYDEETWQSFEGANFINLTGTDVTGGGTGTIVAESIDYLFLSLISMDRISGLAERLEEKQDTEDGKGLSSNDFTNEIAQKLALGTFRFMQHISEHQDYAVTYNSYTKHYIVVGDRGAIWTSPYGITWTKQTSGAIEDFYGVACSNNYSVAVGFGGQIFTSLDDITWTEQNSGVTGRLLGVAYGGAYGTPLFVAVGDDGIITSSNLTFWTQQYEYANLNGVAAQNVKFDDRFVAVGDGGTILTSPDGITWTKQTSGVIEDLYGVAYGDGLWVAVGYNGTILTSPDSITWTIQNSGVTAYLWDIAYGNGLYVAVGNLTSGSTGIILTSSDGITWTEQNSGVLPSSYENGIFYNNGMWVAVGMHDIATAMPSI